MWWGYYLFSLAASPPTKPLEALNWSVLGALFLTILFVGPGASLDVTEALSSRKYAEYAVYQRRVSRFMPWFPKSHAQ